MLDDVQFAARDYQHRARLGALRDPGRQQWLSLPVHRPRGRASAITEVCLVDPAECAHRVEATIGRLYGRSPHFPVLRGVLDQVRDAFALDDRLTTIAAVSTVALLRVLGWRGQVVRASTIPARSGRSERLADLAGHLGARVYLCGTGGARYLCQDPFARSGSESPAGPLTSPTARCGDTPARSARCGR
ncbi:hypothetical protein GCM10010174_00090 [Kutzneria viridogrisea]|uniref:WbqC-like protein family protein n=1 Tax=Kutzneria viridogrisea TaxID=47990 RepID=A0ABR6BCC7_9PSEU|nr:hypothetical protein [Kutzneria viridogrisea]